MRHGSIWLAALAATVLACDASERISAEDSANRAPNLVVITIDTLRADHIGAYGYFRDTTPAIDSLAEESVVFEACYAPVAITLPSHTTLFTGLQPQEHGVVSNRGNRRDRLGAAPHVRTLASFLSEEGYTTAAFVSAEPLKRPSGLAVGFTTWFEPEVASTKANVVIDRALAWLESPPSEPFLLWVHLFDPHLPYEPPAPYDTLFEDDQMDELDAFLTARGIPERLGGETAHPRPSRREHQLYDGEVRFTDHQLSRLFDRLRAADLWDHTAVILTSDHGEGLNQHRTVGHERLWLEQLAIPLLIRVPGLAPRRIADPMSMRDVLPTALRLLPNAPGEGLLAQSTGRDVLATDHRVAPLYAQTPGPVRTHPRPRSGESVQHAGWRLHVNANAPDRLFNLTRDPHELRDVALHHPSEAARLHTQLQQLQSDQDAERRRFRASQPGELSEKRRARLNSLGYVEAD